MIRIIDAREVVDVSRLDSASGARAGGSAGARVPATAPAPASASTPAPASASVESTVEREEKWTDRKRCERENDWEKWRIIMIHIVDFREKQYFNDIGYCSLIMAKWKMAHNITALYYLKGKLV